MSSTTTTPISDKNNLDLMHPSLYDNDEALCHFLTLFPFMVDDEPIVSGYESAFVTYLAVHHLNQRRNGTAAEQEVIISELLSPQLQSCPIRFGVEFLNTLYNPGRALNTLIQRIIGQNNENESEGTELESGDESNLSNSQTTPSPLPSPCAVLGAYRSSISETTATLTSFQGYPQISAMSTSSDLDDRSLYPLFGRTIPSDVGTAQVLAHYFRSVLGISHLALLATNDSFGNAYASELQKAMLQQQQQKQSNTTMSPSVQVQHISMARDGSNIPQVLQNLKELRYRYVFVAHFGGSNMALNDALMEQAYEQGLIQGEEDHYVWMFSDGIVASLAAKRLERNSPLHLAYRGVGSIEATGGLPGNERYDKFAQQLLALKQDFVSSQPSTHPLHALLPFYQEPAYADALSYLHDTSFLSPLTDGRVPLVYDATILLGMAACQAVTNVTSTANEESYLHLDGERFFDTLVNSISFEGLSGLVILDPKTGSRVANSTLFRLVNMVEEDIDDNTVRLIPVNSMIYSEGHWKTLEPFIYNDGTTEPPLDIPPPELQLNYISTFTRAIALVFFVLIVITAFYFWAWTWKKHNTRIVRASQPVFLYLVCLGNIILGESTAGSIDCVAGFCVPLSKSSRVVLSLLFTSISLCHHPHDL
jgi:hypothetical protein